MIIESTKVVGEEKMTNRVYENQELIRNADSIAAEIIKRKKHFMYRDWFFPSMINELGLKAGVEIGVDKAEFSVNVLSRCNIEKWVCIDPWIDNFGSDHKPGYYDASGNVRFEQAKANLGDFQISGRAPMMRQTSVEASMNFSPDSVDFVYIDGDHSLEGIYTDLKAWIQKVKVGGILAGHDYKDGPKSGIQDFWGGQLPYRVETVTNDFCNRNGYALRTVGGRVMSWWFLKNRECDDAVKSYLIPPPKARKT
jgi:hypothetical protein